MAPFYGMCEPGLTVFSVQEVQTELPGSSDMVDKNWIVLRNYLY